MCLSCKGSWHNKVGETKGKGVMIDKYENKNIIVSNNDNNGYLQY